MHSHSIFVIFVLVPVIAQDLPGQVNEHEMFADVRHRQIIVE